MNKQALLEETYHSAFEDELEKTAKKSQDQKGKRIAANIASLGFGLPAGAVGGFFAGGNIGGALGKRKAEKMTIKELMRATGWRIAGRGFRGPKPINPMAHAAVLKPGDAIKSMKNKVISKSIGKGIARGAIPGMVLGTVGLKATLNKLMDKNK